MSKISKSLIVLLTFLLVQPITTSGAETILQKGHSFVMRISGVPADEVALVSQKYGISDEGTIRLPYLKIPLVAAGLKPSVLARKIEAAYKKAEIDKDTGVGIYSLTSIPTDWAEARESLRASIAWCLG